MTAVHYLTIVLLGGYLVATQRMTAVDLATFALYISLFTDAFRRSSTRPRCSRRPSRAFVVWTRCWLRRPISWMCPTRPVWRVAGGAIEYRDVCFSYIRPTSSSRVHPSAP